MQLQVASELKPLPILKAEEHSISVVKTEFKPSRVV